MFVLTYAPSQYFWLQLQQFPTDIPMRKMQGGGTVRTWDIPPEAERLSYYIRTNGRPLKALVELVRTIVVEFFGVACIWLLETSPDRLGMKLRKCCGLGPYAIDCWL